MTYRNYLIAIERERIHRVKSKRIVTKAEWLRETMYYIQVECGRWEHLNELVVLCQTNKKGSQIDRAEARFRRNTVAAGFMKLLDGSFSDVRHMLMDDEDGEHMRKRYSYAGHHFAQSHVVDNLWTPQIITAYTEQGSMNNPARVSNFIAYLACMAVESNPKEGSFAAGSYELVEAMVLRGESRAKAWRTIGEGLLDAWRAA